MSACKSISFLSNSIENAADCNGSPLASLNAGVWDEFYLNTFPPIPPAALVKCDNGFDENDLKIKTTKTMNYG